MKNTVSFLIIFLFGFYGVYLDLVDKLSFYISPRYFTLTVIGAYICVFVGISGIIYTLESSKFKLKELKLEESEIKNTLRFLFSNVFLFAVLAIGLLIPPQSLSARMAANRSGQINNLLIKVEEESIIETFAKSDEEYNLEDWIKSLNINPDLKQYEGRKVNVTGFVFHDKKAMPENEFLAARFVIRCCAVDATPAGLFVKTNWKEEFKVDDWVKVKGVFTIEKFEGRDKLIIIPESIEKTSEPNSPYIL